jgi:RNA polymerase sigma-70 factor (ECF subfamily)
VPSGTAEIGGSAWVQRSVTCARDESALIERLRNRDSAAFDEVYAAHHHYVYRVCRYLVGNAKEVAHDLAQETFVRAYRAIRGFRGECALRTWLYRIAVTTCLQWLRRARRRRERAAEQDARAADGCAMSARLEQIQVREALAALPDHYRALLSLRYFAEFSYREIADAMGWSLGRVKVTLHRARNAFRDHYLKALEGREP